MDKPVNKKPKLKKQEILPKRVGGIYEKIYEYENIKTAIKAVCSSPNATKSKKNEKTNAKQQKEKYLGDIDKYTKIIQALLIEGRYKPRKLRRKEIYDGVRHKKRMIAKPCMIDKIVQRAVLQIIEPILTRRMYMYSCASIKGKGGTYCKRKIERAIARKNRKGKTYKNVKHTKYWEALDIKKCYDNILHCFLKFRLIKMFKDKKVLQYRRKEGADLMAEKIRKTGHKDVFVRMINGLYKVQAGAYTDRKNAEKTEKKLKAAGISCFIVCA